MPIVAAEQITISHDWLVTVAISVTGTLFATLGTLTFYLGKLLLAKLDKKIDNCHLILQNNINLLIKSHDENHESIYHAHDRITETEKTLSDKLSEHVTRLHTK